MTTGSAARAPRAAAFAAVCVTTTALGHALMAGRVPWWALGAAFLGTSAAAYCLTGRERGALVVMGATVAAQLGLHSLFGLAQATTSASLTASAPGTPAVAPMVPSTPMDAMAGMDMSPMGHTGQMSGAGQGAPGMFLAHLLAALVCGLWLWRGEAAVFRLARSLAGLLFAPLLLALATQGRAGLRLPARPLADAPVLRLRAELLHDIVSRRGPPGTSPLRF
ncbi:hypothetical protein ACIRPT_27520 [Streptomyces sp. NPDC101227]|uniref:hypothetical protein n=1 Tax=Streptomyces sp. NPDC101227 TaxID=3366136 RepID=UPI0038288019